MTGDPPVRIHGWTIYAHPLFLEQLDELERHVADLKARKPHEYHKKNPTKRLAAITKLAFDIIPQDPTRPEYRLGDTLGADRKHWFRAKFFQQYRLFFRFSSTDKIIVFAWVNDERSKRAYGAKRDVYRTFRKMLDAHNPPDDWNALIREAERSSRQLHDRSEKPDD